MLCRSDTALLSRQCKEQVVTLAPDIHLELCDSMIRRADWAPDPVPWQQVFPGPGQLPHVTSLKLERLEPALRHADLECVVACCSSLQVLDLDSLPKNIIYSQSLQDMGIASGGGPSGQLSLVRQPCWHIISPALTRLSGLTSLALMRARHQECSALAQLTGLRELRVYDARKVVAAGLHQLAALEQLTSLGFYYLGWSSDVLREHMSDRLQGPMYNNFTPYGTYEYGIISKAPAGQPPDVSARLLLACGMAAVAEHLRWLRGC